MCTGNFAQLALALARLFESASSTGSIRDTSFHIADRQAIVSLLTFNLGAFLGRIGDRVGSHTRLWLILGTFTQALFTMAAALTIWKSGQMSIADDRGDPAWTNVLSYSSLTTVWVELVTDPKLFHHRIVKTRDHKLIAAVSLFTGAFASRAILAQTGAAGALGVACGVRVLVALGWGFVLGKGGVEKGGKGSGFRPNSISPR
ncbi:hypothetical protein D9758_013058 [Tetrapyrgos nigripes]|uniref:Uncharacterized protein n=1 Tax=Tetrapyrgos nigripes TaxID=182062 RepID=A0A8H5CQA5_9AGAR|nr:hypothetical protein D9758_013058 [Tetrapyrgos nigripes]